MIDDDVIRFFLFSFFFLVDNTTIFLVNTFLTVSSEKLIKQSMMNNDTVYHNALQKEKLHTQNKGKTNL